MHIFDDDLSAYLYVSLIWKIIAGSRWFEEIWSKNCSGLSWRVLSGWRAEFFIKHKQSGSLITFLINFINIHKMYCKLKRFWFLDNFDNSGDFEINNWNSVVSIKLRHLGFLIDFARLSCQGKKKKIHKLAHIDTATADSRQGLSRPLISPQTLPERYC